MTTSRSMDSSLNDKASAEASAHLGLITQMAGQARGEQEQYRAVIKWITQKYPCLSAEDEKNLSKRILAGDKKAKDQLVLSNIRLVLRLSRKYAHREGVSLSDLIQDGIMGLLKAVDKFDWSRGHRFSTYACWWIQQAILQSFSEHDRLIRLPGHVVSNLSKVKRIQAEFEETLGRQPTLVELSARTGISQKRLSSILHLTQKTISLQAQVNQGDEGAQELEETITCTTLSPEDLFEQNDLRDCLKRSMSTLLNSREHDILTKRYSLISGNQEEFKKWTLEELGASYGITRESVRQSEQRALRKIRVALDL